MIVVRYRNFYNDIKLKAGYKTKAAIAVIQKGISTAYLTLSLWSTHRCSLAGVLLLYSTFLWRKYAELFNSYAPFS